MKKCKMVSVFTSGYVNTEIILDVTSVSIETLSSQDGNAKEDID